jgi:hypothetical protein
MYVEIDLQEVIIGCVFGHLVSKMHCSKLGVMGDGV